MLYHGMIKYQSTLPIFLKVISIAPRQYYDRPSAFEASTIPKYNMG